jgi:hypothetical protein
MTEKMVRATKMKMVKVTKISVKMVKVTFKMTAQTTRVLLSAKSTETSSGYG